MLVLNGNSQEIVEKFRTFGLRQYEAKAYFALQVCGRTKVANLWQKSGVPQNKIYYTVQHLAMKGLVEITEQSPLEVRARPFLRFANEFLNERKCLLGEIEDMIGQYREVLKHRENFVGVVV